MDNLMVFRPPEHFEFPPPDYDSKSQLFTLCVHFRGHFHTNGGEKKYIGGEAYKFDFVQEGVMSLEALHRLAVREKMEGTITYWGKTECLTCDEDCNDWEIDDESLANYDYEAELGVKASGQCERKDFEAEVGVKAGGQLEPDEVVPKEKKRRKRQKCVNPHKIPRQKSVITCSNCGAKGHNKNHCKSTSLGVMSSQTEFASQLTQEDYLPPTPQSSTQEEAILPPTPQVPKTSIPNPKKPSKKPSNPNQHIAIQDGALHEAIQEQPPTIWDQLQFQQNNEPGGSSTYNMKPWKYVTFLDLNACLAKQSTKMGILLFTKVPNDICSTSRNWGIFPSKKVHTFDFLLHRQFGKTLELLIDEDM
ncbi:cleavage and polyadenylation specificity factor subunit 4, partial [Striga asiatica]